MYKPLSTLRFVPNPLSDVRQRSWVLRCAVGLLLAFVATLVRLALQPLVGDQVPFAIAIATSTLATWVAGVPGGVAATLLSAVLVDYAVVPPQFSFNPTAHLPGQLVFVAVALTLVWQVGRWRRAEEAVRRSEAAAKDAAEQTQRQFLELEAIYQSAPVGLCVLDRDMRWVRLNERLAAMNGYPVEAHIGKTPHELIPDVGKQAEAALRQILETGRPLPDFELSGTTPSEPGVLRWWRERWAPIKDPSGKVVGVAVATEDITEQKRTESAMRAALESARRGEAEIASIYDSAPMGLCIFDREGRFRRVNRRLAEINGLPPEAHIGRTFAEVVPGIAEQAERILRQVLETGQPVKDVEISGELPSQPGVVRTWLEHWYPVRDDQGTVVGVNVAAEEITERKRVEQELRRANQAKDDFLATLSHELRTPLNAILGWAQMLARGDLDEPSKQRAVETIFRNAQAQNELVTDVLDVSRMLTGKLRINTQEVQLLSLLSEAVESARPAARARQIDLHLFSQGQPPPVMADPGRLQQVFWNLLSNAVKFTGPGGRITARVGHDRSTVWVTVEDTGIGIAPEFLPHVFDRFTQADSSPSREQSGLGLGLSIVRHLVELHGGTVTARSDGQGRGSRFTVSLPAAGIGGVESKLNGSQAAAQEHRTGSPGGLHVLVLDDMEDARALVATILEQDGIRVTTAGSADEALERVSKARPDVVLADIGMPAVDGYAFLRRLRALPADAGGSTPAIALTAYGGEGDRRRVLSAGFVEHVPKPVVRERLLAALAAHRPRQQG